MSRSADRLSITLLSILVSAIVGSACAPSVQMTREEQLQLLKSHAQAAEQVYKGTPASKIADSVVKVLTLMDPPDVRFVHYDNRIVMTRFYTAFMGFGSVNGFDIWAVYFDNLPDSSVKVTVRVIGVQSFGIFASIPPVPHVPPTPIEYTDLSEAESKLFFSRLDYMLGLSSEWIPCGKAREFAKTNGYRVRNEFGPFPRVCGDNWFGIEDRKPEEWDKIKGS